MKRFLLGLLFALLPMAALAQSVQPPGPPNNASNYGGSTQITAGVSSTFVSLPQPGAAYQSALVLNDGSNEVFVRLGNSATVTDLAIPPGMCVPIWVGQASSIAAITASSTSLVRISQWSGSPIASCTSSSAGIPLPVGAATAANQATQITAEQAIQSNTTGVSTAANQATANTSLSSIVTNGDPITPQASSSLMLTSLSSVTTLSPPGGTKVIVLKVDQNSDNVRYWDDGTVPTSTTGQEILAGGGTVLRLSSTSNVKIIQESSGAPVAVAVSFYSQL